MFSDSPTLRFFRSSVLASLILAGGGLVAAGVDVPPAVVGIVSHPAPYARTGEIERVSPELDALLAAEAHLEVLAEGFTWAEGPVWSPTDQALLFSDVPKNRVYRWSEAKGISVALEPSGFTGQVFQGRESGSNGLTLDSAGELVLCQHGDRRVARWDGAARTFVTLADRFEGKRFNSPNDLVFDRHGELFFTDPPYGLPRQAPRDLPFQGVFRRMPDGTITLVSPELERPNGIALSPDGQVLYVANSHRPRPVIMAFRRQADGSFAHGTVFFDFSPLYQETRDGSPDGLKVDRHGNVWATGPGGVHILTPEGRRLGTILTGALTANCGWGGPNREWLYLTAHTRLLRIRTQTQGVP